MGNHDKRKVVPFSRDYRRVRRFDMGLPAPTRRRKRSAADPRRYLKGVMVCGVVGLLVLPAGVDGALTVARPAEMNEQTCRIIRVLDGDTVTTICGGTFDRARLIGFDTPELFSPHCAAEATAALRAKWALRGALWQADEIKLVIEGRDRFDRALVRVFLDGQPLAAKMVADGHARAYAGGQRAGWC